MKLPIIGIIGGKGRMGKLFASFFREHGIEVLISDIGTKLDKETLVKKSDIVILSVPIDIAPSVAAEIASLMSKSQALMDFTGIKTPVVKAMLKGSCEVMGMHPMFGDSNPIPGQNVILIPTKKSARWSKWMEEFLTSRKVIVTKMSAKDHDKMMAVAQAFIHFAEIIFVDGLRRVGLKPLELFKYCSPASQLKVQLGSRLIAQDPYLYAFMQLENPYFQKCLKKLSKSMSDFEKSVKKHDLKKFVKLFEKNQKFLGKYKDEAFKDSSYLIDKFLDYKSLSKSSGGARAQKMTKNSVAVLGPKGTFSDQAADQMVDKPQNKYFVSSIAKALELVEKEKLRAAIVPIENNLQGSVRETVDALFLKDISFSSSYTHKIKHNLIATKGSDLKKIKKVYSHSQALNQCRNFCKKYLANAKLLPFNSTAAAAEHVNTLNKANIAVIASEKSVEYFQNLEILKSDIADNKNNATKFVYVTKGKLKNKTSEVVSIAFTFGLDKSGSLFEVTKIFAKAKVNLTKIESRPTKDASGNYVFYLDFEANLKDKKTKDLLKSVKAITKDFKIIGVV